MPEIGRTAKTIVQLILDNESSGTYIVIEVGETDLYLHGTKENVLAFIDKMQKLANERQTN